MRRTLAARDAFRGGALVVQTFGARLRRRRSWPTLARGGYWSRSARSFLRRSTSASASAATASASRRAASAATRATRSASSPVSNSSRPPASFARRNATGRSSPPGARTQWRPSVRQGVVSPSTTRSTRSSSMRSHARRREPAGASMSKAIELPRAEGAVAPQLLRKGELLLGVARAQDLDAQLGRAALPRLPRVEDVAPEAQLHEAVGGDAAARVDGVEVDEVVLADRVLAAERAAEDLVQQVAEKAVAIRLGHLPLRIRGRKLERLHGAHVPEIGGERGWLRH